MTAAWWHRPLFWALLPFTAAQGLWLRRKALRLPGASGDRVGVAGDGPDYHLLAIGDSIIDGVGVDTTVDSLPVQFALALAKQRGLRVHWRIEGTTGHAVSDILARLRSLPDSVAADLVLISVGVNDVTGLSTTRHWRRSLEQLLGVIGQRWPGARLVLAGLPPMGLFPLPPQPLRFSLGLRAATLDRMAAEVARQHGHVRHVPTRIDPQRHDFAPDGFHPSPESCTLWAEELCAELSRDWTPTTARSMPT